MTLKFVGVFLLSVVLQAGFICCNSIGEKCSSRFDCDPNYSFCNEKGTCECTLSKIIIDGKIQCSDGRSLSQSCSNSTDCDTDYSECFNNMCTCEKRYFAKNISNEEICAKIRALPGEKCNEYDILTENSVCVSGKVTCRSEYYSPQLFLGCIKRAVKIGEKCFSSKQCKNYVKSSRCIGFECKCKSPIVVSVLGKTYCLDDMGLSEGDCFYGDCMTIHSQCSLGKCICSSDFFPINVPGKPDQCISDTKLNYGSKCTPYDALVNHTVCVSGFVSCAEHFKVSNKKCIYDIVPLGEICNADFQCLKSTPNSYCGSVCKCYANSVQQNGTCFKKIANLGGNCSGDSICSIENSYCSNDEYCECNAGYNGYNDTNGTNGTIDSCTIPGSSNITGNGNGGGWSEYGIMTKICIIFVPIALVIGLLSFLIYRRRRQGVSMDQARMF